MMAKTVPQISSLPPRPVAEQVFSRTAGAPLVPGNGIRLLKDATENYPAWIEALESAEKFIHFESYIIYSDDVGRRFAEILSAKAGQGVKVRVLYDWLGGLGKASRRFWRQLRQAGVEVRCFNPPRPESPLSWISRDHRKMIGVDGRIAYITGLCVGRKWMGDPEGNVPPWRDTGIEIRGPAVADAEEAFADVWAVTGDPLPAEEIPDRKTIEEKGDVSLRVIATAPQSGGIYRLDQMIASLARRTLWLTDAYFIGTTSYIQALKAAAKDGVDVRLLVPSATDIPFLRVISRAGYQTLLESGIRIFEWNGPMMHSKTAVADGKWGRVGSTNLNISSWMGNYELDVAVEDEGFARTMEEMYLADLEKTTELLLNRRHRVRPAVDRKKEAGRVNPSTGRRVGRAGAGALRFSSTLGAAMTDSRILGPAEARITALAGIVLLALAAVGIFMPRGLSIPFALICGWVAISLFIRTYKLVHAMKKKEEEVPDADPPEP